MLYNIIKCLWTPSLLSATFRRLVQSCPSTSTHLMETRPILTALAQVPRQWFLLRFNHASHNKRFHHSPHFHESRHPGWWCQCNHACMGGGHPETDILLYPFRCMMFEAVRNERAHGSVGRRSVWQPSNQHVASSNPMMSASQQRKKW